MNDSVEDTEYVKFVQSIIDNVKKNGFPDKKVAFPLVKMYELAEDKGINFNKVLVTLDEIQIAHKKTEQKIIFYPKDREPEPQDVPPVPDALSDMAANINPEMFKGMNMSEMMSGASKMIENMNPEQLEAVKDMYENMSEEDRAAMIEQVKKMGLF